MAKRINKYLSEIGYCSRREADRLIDAKRILINDQLPELGTKIYDGDIVKVDGTIVSDDNTFVYLILNKPKGITSTTDQTDPTNIIDFMNYPKRIFHIGRLDKDSEGLILMTNDGDIVNKILRSNNQHEKEYIVTVDKKVTKQFIQGMSKGVPILDTVTRPCKVDQINVNTFRITLTEGLNRQIRRMCTYFDYTVKKLKRVRIMHIKLDIPLGEYRELTKLELEELFSNLKYSSKTEEASLTK